MFAPRDTDPNGQPSVGTATNRSPRLTRDGSLMLALIIALALVACGSSGSCTPEECVCDAADEAVFDNCNPQSFFDIGQFIRPALEACDIFADDDQIMSFESGDVGEECLASGFAQGISEDEADDAIDFLEGLSSCSEIADAFEQVCGLVD